VVLAVASSSREAAMSGPIRPANSDRPLAIASWAPASLDLDIASSNREAP
jgi:hypothetical protein